MSFLSDSQLKGLGKRLHEQKLELLELEKSASDTTGVVELDQTRQGRLSRMDALQGQAMSVAIKHRRHMQLKQIDSALQRIADGEYGYCLRCGEEIAHQRLEYNPAVTLCLKCAD